jgi:hypothetical protein
MKLLTMLTCLSLSHNVVMRVSMRKRNSLLTIVLEPLLLWLYV